MLLPLRHVNICDLTGFNDQLLNSWCNCWPMYLLGRKLNAVSAQLFVYLIDKRQGTTTSLPITVKATRPVSRKFANKPLTVFYTNWYSYSKWCSLLGSVLYIRTRPPYHCACRWPSTSRCFGTSGYNAENEHFLPNVSGHRWLHIHFHQPDNVIQIDRGDSKLHRCIKYRGGRWFNTLHVPANLIPVSWNVT